MEKGMLYNGFILIEERKIEEANSIGRIFEHKKSGARLLHLSNDDDNKVFNISFRTPPSDSTGVPHILEHSVLCGSRKYPLKDPFVELAKGSLNTFLNAMTFSDKTMYPIASRNDQDFLNLMDVYLDAVFYPNIYTRPEILKQEGWHYELNDKKEDITYKGVVYNEMKGAFSSPEQVLFRKIEQSLFPDTPYSTESGGDPEFITDLTQKDFENFHKKYYHPSNSYIYLYGDGELLEQLKWLDENYLNKFDKINVDSLIPMQEKFNAFKEIEDYYPIANNETEDKKTYLSYNVVMGNAIDKELHYSIDILEYILLETPGAPLKKALLDAGIGVDVFGSADNGILQPTFSIIAKNSTPDQKENFVKIINNTLTKLVDEGIDKKLIEAAINRFEFKLREGDYGRYPKGLMYCINAMSSWLYDEDPMIHLEYKETFKNIKKALTSDYFEKMIEKYILKNTHGTIVMIKPQRGLATLKEEQLKTKLKTLKDSLTDDELNKLVKETKHLNEYQSTPSSKEDIEKIPLLSLEDIRKDSDKIVLEEKNIGNVKTLFHPIFTNEIGYVSLYFNIKYMPDELIPYAGLLTKMLSKIDTKNYSYNNLVNEININTGGIGYSVSAYGEDGKWDVLNPYFVVSSKAFYDKIEKLYDLVGEILLNTSFEDDNRIKEIIGESISRIEMNMMQSGHMTTANRAQSYYSPSAKYKELTKGLDFYEFLTDINENYENKIEEVKDNLIKTMNCIFQQQNMFISFIGEEKIYNEFENISTTFIDKLNNNNSLQIKEMKLNISKKNEGLTTAEKVQYVAKVGNFIKSGYHYDGSIRVLQTILSLDYLWNRVRVKGGAYGCMVGFTRMGDMYFTSYRDPNLCKTLDVYDDVCHYINNFECDDREMLKYIIGTISRVDAPMTPSMKGQFALDCYLSGINDEKMQIARDELLSTDVQKIRELAKLVNASLEQDNICVQGNEDKINSSKEIFNNIRQLIN